MARPGDPEKEKHIFQATLKLVLAEGFAGLKMADVARESKVATGTVYVYFHDKEDLINALYLHLKKAKAARLLKGNLPAKQPFKDRFQWLWERFFEDVVAYPAESAFLEQYYRSPFLRQDVINTTDSLLQPVFDLLEEGQQGKHIKNLPIHLIVAQLTGPIFEYARQGTLQPSDREILFSMAWSSVST